MAWLDFNRFMGKIDELFFNHSPAISAHPEMIDFGSGQGRSGFETAGVALLRRGFQKRENAGLSRKMPFLAGHYLKTNRLN